MALAMLALDLPRSGLVQQITAPDRMLNYSYHPKSMTAVEFNRWTDR